ncbi:FHA domain-containing protein [Aliiglaciecola lipolytica]|uniref:FHA domain-containing protein n=1 Tax=Aliiglaciecola lipolytica TaxID=477689 RepID=UPI001C0A028C|nr:FHA domain-containing protein [Aliiglaciecola lipolytica]MBU2876790.1 FHA domain-containing protein [Aliiglaciecola lipolytica]
MFLSPRLIALLALVFSSTIFSATAETYAYQVQIERKNGKTQTAIATKVNDNQFVTDAEVIDGAKSLFIVDNSVTPAAKILATVIVQDEDKRLAVLSASNVTGDPVLLAKEAQTVGEQLILKTDSEETPSIVQRLEPVKDLSEGDIYVHTALYQEGQWAAPLLNNCKQLVGVSVFETAIFAGMKAPENIAYALSTQTLKSFLSENNITFSVADEVCLSDVEQAKAKAEQAAKDAEEASKLAELAKKAKEDADLAAKTKLEEAQKKAQEAKEEADRLLQEAKDEAAKIAAENLEKQKKTEDAIKKAEEERLALEEAKAKAEQAAELEAQKQAKSEQQKTYILLGGGVLLLVMLLLFVILMRKRKEAMQAQTDELQNKVKEASGLAQEKDNLAGKIAAMEKSFNDILLDGSTTKGDTVRIKINGKALAQSEGQIIGRESAQVDYVLGESEISRKHLMIRLHENKIYVEDMGSQNGSWLNEVQLIPGQPMELSNDMVLRLSTISFKVTVL